MASSPARDGLDRDKLIKLLGLTGSEHDGEALAALRRVQRMLREADLGWEDLFAAPGAKSWTQAFEFSTQYFFELKRRVSAEKAAERWQAIARAHQDELRRLRAEQQPPAAKPARPAPVVTAHPLIDRLLAAQGLESSQRARVEAIASWYRKTNSLTKAEEADLETFARQLEAAAA